jgi:hypothetical protein
VLGEQNIAPKRVVGGGGESAFRPIALVKDHAQPVRAPVEQKAVTVHTCRSNRGVALRSVEDLVGAVQKLELDLDQRGRLGAPQQFVT